MQYTDNQLKERLLEIDYPKNERILNNTIRKIKNLSEKSQTMFETWFKTGKVDDFEINGITPSYLRKKTPNVKDVAIILAYDWLLREPEKATHAIKAPIIKSEILPELKKRLEEHFRQII